MNASTTPRLELPFLQSGQALKNITHNEALQRLDSGFYLSCSDMSVDLLPAAPVDGLAVIISDTPDNSLTDYTGHIAVFTAVGWLWYTPKSGWTVWDEVGGALRVYDGQDWVSPIPESASVSAPDAAPQFGINASTSPGQRLAVASDTSLFNHDGGSHRLTLNRAATAETASLVFQTNFAGAAELGLTGEDGFTLKTTVDGGAVWSERLSTPPNFPGIQSPGFMSQRLTIDSGGVVMIPTPRSGGILAMTIVSEGGQSQGRHTALVSYDTGTAPLIIMLTATRRIENLGNAVPDGTSSEDGNIGLSAGLGGIYIENRLSIARQFSLTFFG